MRQEIQHKPYTEPVRMKADMIIVAKKNDEESIENDMYNYDIIFRRKFLEKDSKDER